jgi:hypothetical protein
MLGNLQPPFLIERVVTPFGLPAAVVGVISEFVGAVNMRSLVRYRTKTMEQPGRFRFQIQPLQNSNRPLGVKPGQHPYLSSFLGLDLLLLLLDNRLAVIRHHTGQCLHHDAKIGRDTFG